MYFQCPKYANSITCIVNISSTLRISSRQNIVDFQWIEYSSALIILYVLVIPGAVYVMFCCHVCLNSQCNSGDCLDDLWWCIAQWRLFYDCIPRALSMSTLKVRVTKGIDHVIWSSLNGQL